MKLVIDQSTGEFVELMNLVHMDGQAVLILPGWEFFIVGYLA
jgi:hypothetical protein